jgi:hypothetical protein
VSKVDATSSILTTLVEKTGNVVLVTADGKVYFTDDESGSVHVYNKATQTTTSISVLDLDAVGKSASCKASRAIRQLVECT